MTAPKVFKPWSEYLPLKEGVEVIAEDGHGVIALSKPAGVLSHPNESGGAERSLIQAPYKFDQECYEVKDSTGVRRFWLLNRLDSATSGVLLLAAQETLANEIRTAFQQRQVHKLYNALVFGTPHAAKQVWKDRLAVAKKGARIRTEAAGNVPSEAHMRVIQQWRSNFSLSLIELNPKTGRSHQLRVQCAQRHLPIVGDATYGDFKVNREFAKQTGEKRLFLHSLETAFEYRWKGKNVPFEAKAPLPKEFLSVGR